MKWVHDIERQAAAAKPIDAVDQRKAKEGSKKCK
jgi:hypothetical protein